MLRGCLTLFAQCLVSGVFIISGTTKLRDLPGFGATVQRLVPIPSRGAVGAARLIVLTELVAAGLVWYAGGRIGLALAGLVFAGLAGIAFRAAAMPDPVPCRCFGTSTAPLGKPHAVRNLVLAGIAVAGLLSAGPQQQGPPAAGIALSVTAAAVGVLITVFFDDLAELARP